METERIYKAIALIDSSCSSIVGGAPSCPGETEESTQHKSLCRQRCSFFFSFSWPCLLTCLLCRQAIKQHIPDGRFTDKGKKGKKCVSKKVSLVSFSCVRDCAFCRGKSRRRHESFSQRLFDRIRVGRTQHPTDRKSEEEEEEEEKIEKKNSRCATVSDRKRKFQETSLADSL